jgi:hypothetical protein
VGGAASGAIRLSAGVQPRASVFVPAAAGKAELISRSQYWCSYLTRAIIRKIVSDTRTGRRPSCNSLDASFSQASGAFLHVGALIDSGGRGRAKSARPSCLGV